MPTSKMSALWNFTSPNTGSVVSNTAELSGGAPKKIDTAAAPAEIISPAPRSRPASNGIVSPSS